MTGLFRTTRALVATVGAGVGLALVGAPVAQVVTHSCHGYAATIVGTTGSDDVEAPSAGT